MNAPSWPGRVHVAAAAGALIAPLLLSTGVACDANRHETNADYSTDDPATGRDVRVPEVLGELGGDHFAGLEVQGQHIVSYWAGAVPTEAKEYAESEPEGMTIDLVTSARFSRDQLTAAAERIITSEVAHHAGISLASANSDGSGLEIAVEGSEPSRAVQREIAALAALPEDAIHYAPNSGPVVRTPPTVVSPPEQEG